MRILLVGHFCFDVVHSPEGVEEERPGGIFNAAAKLSSLMGRNDIALPVCGIAREDYGRVAELFSALPNVDTDGLYRFDGSTNRVHVFPHEDGSSIVCAKDIAPPIPFERLRKHLDVDAVLVNMISGMDITLETLDLLRITLREDGIPLHLDFHNLTLGVNEKHERFRRPVETWRRWAFMNDTVQLNEREILDLDATVHSEEAMAGHLLMLGIKNLVVTRGRSGATLYQGQHKQTVRTDIPAPQQVVTVNDVGYGDRFGAAMVYFNRKLKNPLEAVRQAVESVISVQEEPK